MGDVCEAELTPPVSRGQQVELVIVTRTKQPFCPILTLTTAYSPALALSLRWPDSGGSYQIGSQGINLLWRTENELSINK